MTIYGPDRRKKARRDSSKKTFDSAFSDISEAWQAIIGLANGEPEFMQFYSAVKQLEEDKYSGTSDKVLLRSALQSFMMDTQSEYPDIQIPGNLPVIERLPPVKGLAWLKAGKSIRQAIDHAMMLWLGKTEYNELEAYHWMQFSAAVWGGLNDPRALKALINFVKKKGKIHFIENLPICQLEVERTDYGNFDKDGVPFQSVTFVPDTITAMWIIHLYKRIRVLNPIDLDEASDFGQIFPKIGLKLSMKEFLDSASYIWEQLPGAAVPQALVQVAKGRQATCSLSIQEMQRVLDESYPSIKVDSSTLDSLGKSLRFSQSVPLLYDVDRKKNFSKDLNKLLDKEFLKGRKISEPVSEFIDDLCRKYNTEPEVRLIRWIEYLIPQDGPLMISSINSYLGSLRSRWLENTVDLNIDELNSEEWTTLYESMLPEDGSKIGNLRTAINNFHRFQIMRYGAPSISLDEFEHLEITKARFLKPRLVEETISALMKIDHLHEVDRNMLRAIFTLSWRTGMRISEILSIQIRDVEANPIHQTDEPCVNSIIVRSNSLAGIKSPSSRRRIPIKILLGAKEQEWLDKVWRRRITMTANDDSPLFAPANYPGAFKYGAVRDVFNNLVQLFDPISDYTIHSLRHTTLNSVYLSLTQQSALLPVFTDFTDDQQLMIREALLGRNPGNAYHRGQDHFYGLALLAGHASPNQTFRSYLHFAHLDLGERIMRGELSIHVDLFQNLIHVSRRQLSYSIPEYSDRHSHIERSQTMAFMKGQLSQWSRPWHYEFPHHLVVEASDQFTNASNDDLMTTESDLKIFPGHRGSRITPDLAYRAIELYEDGESNESIATRLDVHPDLTKRWVDRAKILANLRSGRGSPKLIDPKRIGKNGIIPLLPVNRFNDEERLLIESAFRAAPYICDESQEDFLEFINLYLKRVSGSRSEIRFTINQEAQLKRYLSIAKRLISNTDWNLIVNNNAMAKNYRSPKQWKYIKVVTRSEEIYRGYAVSLAHPNPPKTSGDHSRKSHYSSGAMRYIMHMLMIGWPYGDLSNRVVHRDPVHYGLKKSRATPMGKIE